MLPPSLLLDWTQRFDLLHKTLVIGATCGSVSGRSGRCSAFATCAAHTTSCWHIALLGLCQHLFLCVKPRCERARHLVDTPRCALLPLVVLLRVLTLRVSCARCCVACGVMSDTGCSWSPVWWMGLRQRFRVFDPLLLPRCSVRPA